MQIRPQYLKLWWFLYFINEKFNKNAKVEQLTKKLWRSVRLIVIGPLIPSRFCKDLFKLETDSESYTFHINNFQNFINSFKPFSKYTNIIDLDRQGQCWAWYPLAVVKVYLDFWPNVPPLFMNNLCVMFESDWTKTVVCIQCQGRSQALCQMRIFA